MVKSIYLALEDSQCQPLQVWVVRQGGSHLQTAQQRVVLRRVHVNTKTLKKYGLQHREPIE